MLQTLKLLVPALIPSWRFFDIIAPSPRIEFALLKTAQEKPRNWQEFRPRPAYLSPINMLIRLFWNPNWNESLYMVSCAERLMANQSTQCYQEILKNIEDWLKQNPISPITTPYLQFRLVFLSRQGEKLQKYVTFTSQIHQYIKNTAA